MTKKTYQLLLLFVMLTLQVYSQQQGEVVQIMDDNTVKLTFNEKLPNVGDIFIIKGSAEVIHPATGQLITRDDAVLGKIEIISIEGHNATGKITEKKHDIARGNKIYRIQETPKAAPKEQATQISRTDQNAVNNSFTDKLQDVANKKTKKKKKHKKTVCITKIEQNNGTYTAVINKGTETKAKGGKPKPGKKYYAFVPVVDTSQITGQTRIEGEEYIGKITIVTTEHDASSGTLQLIKAKPLSFIENSNILRIYKPKLTGWHHILRANIISFDHEDNINNPPYPHEFYSFLSGIELINGYKASQGYFIGIGVGYNHVYHQPYRDALICNLPIYLHQRINIFKRKNSLTFNISAGKNAVLNSEHDIRPYDIQGKYFFSGGLGIRSHIQDYGALLIDVDFEYKTYGFENYSRYSEKELMYITLKLGFALNYSPLN